MITFIKLSNYIYILINAINNSTQFQTYEELKWCEGDNSYHIIQMTLQNNVNIVL